MLEDLISSIDELGLNEEKYRSYTLVATHFRRFDEGKKEFVRIDMPQNEIAYFESKKIDKPIFEIVKDDNDPELCLITRYLPEETSKTKKPIVFSKFYDQISNLQKESLNLEVISSAWEHLDDNHLGRTDIPIIAIFVDEENKRICLVER